jgi:hypothetical protein
MKRRQRGIRAAAALAVALLTTGSAAAADAPWPGSFTKRSWSLSGMETTDASGMEGLTFVPNGYHPYPVGEGGGLFYASSQKNGRIYVFDVFAKPAGGAVSSIADFRPDPNEHDVADLSFSTGTRTLYVLYGNARRILEVQGDTLENGAAYSAPAVSKDDKENKGFEGIASGPTTAASPS